MGIVISIFLILSQLISAAQFTGKVYERGTRKPLVGVSIYILPQKEKIITDSQGIFSVELEKGEYQFIVNEAGYDRYEQSLSIDKDQNIDFYIEKSRYSFFETTILGKEKRQDESARSLKAAEISKIPGASNDPVSAVSNLPGISRQGGFDSRVVIQGSAPEDTNYSINDHQVPNVFHFGGLTSVLFPESIERVDYLSAGYGPEWGRALGGIINLSTRSPRNERSYGMAFADFLKAGAMLEGPINENHTYFIGVRKSYIGSILRKIFKNNPDFNLTVAPSFSDLTAIYEGKLSSKDNLRVNIIGSRDELGFLLKEPADQDPGFRGAFEFEQNFVRIIPQWTRKFSDRSVGRFSLGIGKTWQRTILGESYFFLRANILSVRTELERRMNENWISSLGVDNQYTNARVEFDLPAFSGSGGVFNPIASSETRRASTTGAQNVVGTYLRNDLYFFEKKWIFSPNIRFDYFGTSQEVTLGPRPSVVYQWDSSFKTRFGSGIYYQPPEPQEVAPFYGNPDLKPPRAYHATLTIEKDFRRGGSEGFELQGGPFYRYFDRLVVNSSARVVRNGVYEFEKFNNNGFGEAIGFETLLKYQFFPLSGWVSYTLSKSERWKKGEARSLSAFDQTHNLNIINSYELPRHWSLGSRVRFVTGNPTTPITGGVYDADNDVYIPSRGPVYSERLDPFFQTDIRIDKKWVYDTWMLSAYLDIQNIFNSKNAESVQYSYNYGEKKKVTGLPILPILGLKGEF